MKNVKLNFKAKRFYILWLIFIPITILINVVLILFIYNDPYLIFDNFNKDLLTLMHYIVILSMLVLVFFLNRYEPKEITINGEVLSIIFFPKYFIKKSYLNTNVDQWRFEFSSNIDQLRFEQQGSKIFVYIKNDYMLIAIMRKNALNDKAWNWLVENLLHKE